MYKVLSYVPPSLYHTTLCVLTLIHSWSNCDKYIFGIHIHKFYYDTDMYAHYGMDGENII